MRMESGQTSINDWMTYHTGNGVYVDVNTAAAGFKSIPHYVVSLYGKSQHWAVTGVTSIYNASISGFRVYLRWSVSGNIPLNAAHAQEKGWYLRWTGIEL
jgi:hypothetical protein